MGIGKLTDWTKIKCTRCKYHKRCRRKSIAKGSKMCMEMMGRYTPPQNKKKVSEKKQMSALLWNLLGKYKK